MVDGARSRSLQGQSRFSELCPQLNSAGIRATQDWRIFIIVLLRPADAGSGFLRRAPPKAAPRQGEIFEDLYAAAAGAGGEDAPPRLVRRTPMPRGHVGYINDGRGLHAVGNPSPAVPAVSLHLYHPPIRSCLAFAGDAAAGAAVRRDICFHSVGGVLVNRE